MTTQNIFEMTSNEQGGNKMAAKENNIGKNRFCSLSEWLEFEILENGT